MLQPSPEVFALFDDVLILNEGRVMYHGPRDQALGYFESLGFKCPPRRDVADFLLDVGTSQQHKYEVARADGSKHPRKAREFAEIFENSAIHHKMLEDLHGPYDPLLLKDKELHFDQVPQFHQSFWASTMTLMRRQLQITMRNTAFIKGRGLMVIIMGLMYSSVFWQFDVKQAQVVMGIMFAAVLFLALGQASQIPTYMAAREIFYKQRGANFFRTLSYVLACSVSQLPLALLESLVFGSMVYWMCGFVPTVQAYVIFELLLFLTNLAFAAWFFFLSALSPDLHQAKPISMVSIMFYILFAGFVISKNQIPDYFIWAYWLNPIAWCLRSLAINQYRDDRFNVDVYDGIDYKAKFGLQMGEYSLSLFDVESEKVWLWYGFIFMIVSYVFFMSISFFALEYKRYESPEHVGMGGEDDGQPIELASASSTSGSDDYAIMETPRADATGDIVLEVKATHRERNFVPVTLAFKDLWYSVPDPANPKENIDLLKGISGRR
ncbi:hypothetical protein P43SY_011544 [Pythium insidiosum]|uniref:ABC-2 type transporter domain-containing protein n=1 Tax=Pythium insidiosum TaxID=114742 RepID=A0AAD5L759_PYTIN|nr:hypothetical protein P43SY_011544 [Pythium insidiosum]